MKCILLHGLGQNPTDWKDTIAYFDDILDVSCPALYEWLSSKGADYTHLYHGLEKYCEQLEEPFILGGLSLGGVLALQYAIEHREKVYALFLIGAQFSMPKNLLRFQNAVFRLLPNSAFGSMGMEKKDVICLCKSMRNLDFRHNLQDIPCRTLVLCGGKDKSNLSAAIQLEKQIENSELIIIPGAGHELNTEPTALGETIRSFCLNVLKAEN